VAFKLKTVGDAPAFMMVWTGDVSIFYYDEETRPIYEYTCYEAELFYAEHAHWSSRGREGRRNIRTEGI
jgi:hypothetical protein